MFVLCLFIPFPHGYTVSRGVPLIFNAQHYVLCFFMCRKTTSGENPTEWLAFGGYLQTLALCTVCSFADTLRRFVRSPCTRRHGNSFVKITPPDENLRAYIINYKSAPVPFVNGLMKNFLFLLRARIV